MAPETANLLGIDTLLITPSIFFCIGLGLVFILMHVKKHIYANTDIRRIYIGLIDTCLFFDQRTRYFLTHFVYCVYLFISADLSTRRLSCVCKLQPFPQKVTTTFTCQGLVLTILTSKTLFYYYYFCLNVLYCFVLYTQLYSLFFHILNLQFLHIFSFKF